MKNMRYFYRRNHLELNLPDVKQKMWETIGEQKGRTQLCQQEVLAHKGGPCIGAVLRSKKGFGGLHLVGKPQVRDAKVVPRPRRRWPVNQMGFTKHFFILDSRRVFPPAPKVLGAKHFSNPDVAPFKKKGER